MKKFTIYLLILTVFSSCENMLKEVPIDFVARANYYQNETDANGALTGAYSTIGTDFFGIGYYLVVELHGDFLQGRGSQSVFSVWDKSLPSNQLSGQW